MEIYCTTWKRFLHIRKLLDSLEVVSESIIKETKEEMNWMKKCLKDRSEPYTICIEVRPSIYEVEFYTLMKTNVIRPIRELSDDEIRRGVEEYEKQAAYFEKSPDVPILTMDGMKTILVKQDIIYKCANFLQKKGLPRHPKRIQIADNTNFILMKISDTHFSTSSTNYTSEQEVQTQLILVQSEMGISVDIKCIGVASSLEEFITILTTELLI